jgi:HD superfamily phosphohydrolase
MKILQIFDRLYGEIKFPEIIQNLLDCPGLLRLRDVRMANNQFVMFPAFSNASRYEHSIGVCYLAGLCAKSLDLSEKDTIELMMACLYHDVGTPPFAHAMEEVLRAEYGFDHEENLRQIIEGRNDSYAGNLEQIYMGETVKLRSVCQSKRGRNLGLDVYRIARIIVGDKSDPLSILLNGNGMDLDNIDNVVRASSAMGIISAQDCELATRLANSFVFNDKGEICFNAFYLQDIRRWQRIRDEQYTAIFNSIDDFSYQTMIKKALSLLIRDHTSRYSLNRDSWKLTDASILYDYLLKNEKSEPIMRRVLLNKPFRCLTILYVQGVKVVEYINNHISDIEDIASQYYQQVMQISRNYLQDYDKFIVANFYPDKRKRQIHTVAYMMGTTTQIDKLEENEAQGALLGLFTPIISNNYRTVDLGDGLRARKVASFSNINLQNMIELLKEKIFDQYEVTIYGKQKNRPDSEKTSGNQLGFL